MIALEEIRRARERIGDSVLRTPLIRYDERIWLKLECLQPIGCYNLRGGLSAVRAASASGKAAPLAASVGHPEPQEINYEPSWVDGAGGRSIIPEMWERAQELVDEAVAVPLEDVAEAVRLVAQRAHIVAEGAGALALATAL